MGSECVDRVCVDTIVYVQGVGRECVVCVLIR